MLPVVGQYLGVPIFIGQHFLREHFEEVAEADYFIINDTISKLFHKREEREDFSKCIANFATLTLAPILEPIYNYINNDKNKQDILNTYIYGLIAGFMLNIAYDRQDKTNKNLIVNTDLGCKEHKNQMESSTAYYLEKYFLSAEYKMREVLLHKIYTKMPVDLKYKSLDFKEYFVIAQPSKNENN